MSGIKAIAKKSIVAADDVIDDMKFRHLRKGEFRKYNSPKRKAIYETVTLTDSQKNAIDELFESS